MARDELQVIDRTYQLLKCFLGRLAKFPRAHRYGLVVAMDGMDPQITQIAQIRETGLGHMTCRANGRDGSGRHSICENLRNLRTEK